MLSLMPVIKLLTPKPSSFSEFWFRHVAGAAEYAQIRPDGLPLPAAWVVRSADKGESIGEREDEITPSFDVVIAIENARTHEPGETDELLLKYRWAVYRALRGNQVVPDTDPVKFHGGRVIEYTDGDLYWADRYSFGGVIDNYLPDPSAQFLEVNNSGGKLL
jgi:hypothetical protein